MAGTRKSAKRTARKKRSGAKRAAAGKRPVRKAAAKRRTSRRSKTRGTTGKLKRKAARTLRTAGEKTWEMLKSTTSQVVEGVKEKLGTDTDRTATSPG